MSDFILPEPLKEQITSTPGTLDVLPPPQEQVFTEAEKASSVINQIKQMPDPSEGIARLYASKHLAERLGKTTSEVFRDFDAATAQYYGEIKPPKDWLKAIGDEMKIQAGVMKMGRLGAEAAHAKTPEEFAEKWEEYIATKRSLPDPDTISRSFPVEMTKQTLGLVSQMLSTIPESWDVGLAAGAGGAGIAALVGGPVLTTAGLMYVAGAAGKTEYGNAFMEMLESGVDFDIAKAAAYGPGILNGLGEAGQYALLVKGLRVIPGVGPVLDKAISKTLQSAWVTKAFTNKAVQFAGRVIGGTAGEVGVELAQESTTMAFTALAKYFQNEARGTNLPQATIEEVTKRLLEIGKTSAMGFAGLTLISTGIGSVRSGFKAKKAETKPAAANVPEGAEIPAEEAPTPTGRPREQVRAEYDEAFRVLEANPNDATVIDRLAELSIELEEGEAAEAPKVDLSDDEWLSRRRAEATEAATTEERNTLETFKARIQENVPGMDNPQDLEIVSFAAKKFADSVGVDPDSFLDAALVPGIVGPELEGQGVAQGAVAGAQFVKVNDKMKMALRFTEGANGSSVVHELSHAYINFLRENSATPEVSRVLQEIEKSFGIEGGNWDAEAPGWTEAYQGSNRSFWEYYSYSLEDYIQTGQAPNAELKSIFDRIIQWLKEVYRELSRRTEVSPEVQQYFDRLFSTEERTLYQAEMSAVPEVRDEQGRLLAPNGKPSKLNEFQWKQVRTPAFLKWFGDWINDPANASKVVDENGEPMVVYHGTRNDFTVFDADRTGHNYRGYNAFGGFSFTSSEHWAGRWGYKARGTGEVRTIPVFLKILNPVEAGKEWYSNESGIIKKLIQKQNADGIFTDAYNAPDFDAVVFEPTQIKSATANIGTFDPDNPSILYQGETSESGIKEYIRKSLLDMGFKITNDGMSNISNSEYLNFTLGDDGQEYKVRISDHDLPMAYQMARGSRFFDINAGESIRPDAISYIEFLELVSREHGKELPGYVKQELTEKEKRDEYLDSLVKERLSAEAAQKSIETMAAKWSESARPELYRSMIDGYAKADKYTGDKRRKARHKARQVLLEIVDAYKAENVLYQGDTDAQLIREDVEATRWVPDSILERYRNTEWGKAEIERRDDLRREAAEFEDEAEFVSFQMTMDPEATPAQREYYQRIYESRESVSAEPIVSREDANRRFIDALDKPGLEALISNLIGQNFDDLGPVFKIMDHKLFSSAVKTVRGGGHLSDGHYKRLMDQIRYDVAGFRDAVLVAAGDQDEYAQFIKEVITDKTAEELEQRKRELSALKREIDKKTTTIESLTRDIERERFYSKNMDTKVKALDEALKSAQAEAPMATRETAKKYIDALSSARKEAKAQATRAKKDAEKRIRDLYETRAKVTKLIKLIVKPPSKAMHWKEQKRLLQLQSTYITGLSKTQKEHRARLASILERVTEPDLIAKIKAELGIRNLKEMTIEELENLATQVQGIRRNGIDMRKLKLLEEKIRFHADKDKILEALGPLMKEQIQGRMSKEGKKAARTKLLKNIGLKALTPERVMEMFQGKTEGPFKELFIDLINEATDRQIRNEMERQKKLEAALERNNLKLADMGKTVKLYDFTYTRQDIMGFYLQMQNEESKAALLGGDRITEAQAREFIGNLTQEEKRFADELSEIVGGDEEFNRLEESIGENRNELMGRVERYFPMLRQNPGATAGIDQQVAAEILERKGLSRGGVRHGWSKSRIKISLENQKPIRHDSINVAFQQITAQERYIATQPALKRLAKIVNDSTVQDAMIRSHGYEAVQWMQKYIGDLANPDIYNDTVSRTSRFLRNNAATAYLAFNALTILKQFPSVLYYLGDVGPHHLIHAAGQFFHNPAALIREVKAMDPQVARRSIDRVFEELRQIDLNAWEKAIKKIGTVGMRGIAFMDMVAVTIGWKAVYNAELAKSGDPGKAIKRAQEVTMRTQPSARVQNLPEIYRTNEGLNWLLMFTNQLNKIFNILAWDIPTAFKEGQALKALGYTTAILMSGVAMGAISRKRPPEEPGELAEDIVTQVLNSVPIIGGNIVAGLSGWGDSGVNPFPVVDKAAGTFKDIFGGEKDMEEIVESIGRTLLEGMVLTGLPQVATKRMYKTFIDELGDFQFNPWELIGGEPKE